MEDKQKRDKDLGLVRTKKALTRGEKTGKISGRL